MQLESRSKKLGEEELSDYALSHDAQVYRTSDALLARLVDGQLSAGTFRRPVTHHSLMYLGNAMELTCSQCVENNAHVFRITREIQEYLKVARFYVSGPYGRRVSIGTPYIDLVVFLAVDLKSSDDRQLIESPDTLLDGLHQHLVAKLQSNSNVDVFSISTSHRWPTEERSTRKQNPNETTARNASSPPYIPVRIGDARFRVFLAPALARTPEDQRQATYRLMQRLGGQNKHQALVSLYPALIERPSEDIAGERPDVHAFIRVCQYWIRLQQLDSLEEQATEILALTAARRTLASSVLQPSELARPEIREPTVSRSTPTLRPNTLDFFAAFKTFLCYCSALDTLSQTLNTSIQPPFSLADSSFTASGPVVRDEFNPYRNFLDTLTSEDQQRLQRSASRALLLIEQQTSKACLGEQPSNDSRSSASASCSSERPLLIADLFRPLYATEVSQPSCFPSLGTTSSSCWLSLLKCRKSTSSDKLDGSAYHRRRKSGKRCCTAFTLFSFIVVVVSCYIGVIANRHHWDWETLKRDGVADFWHDHARFSASVRHHFFATYLLLSRWFYVVLDYLDTKWRLYVPS